jgi:hypothetical protein
MEIQANGRVGRPQAFSQERADRAVEAVRAGHTRRAAAQAAGVGASTLFRWLECSERPDAPEEYRDFWDRIHSAEAESERSLVDIVLAEAKSGSWRAATWLLEKRHAREWAPKAKVEFNTPAPGAQAREIQSTIDEANAAADLMMEIPKWIGRPLEDWPPEVRRASGF